MSEHELKCWPQYYDRVADGSKPFELRFNDRDFKVGDVLHLRRWDPAGEGRYTGESLRRRVTCKVYGFGLDPSYVAMGLAPVEPMEVIERAVPQPWPCDPEYRHVLDDVGHCARCGHSVPTTEEPGR